MVGLETLFPLPGCFRLLGDASAFTVADNPGSMLAA